MARRLATTDVGDAPGLDPHPARRVDLLVAQHPVGPQHDGGPGAHEVCPTDPVAIEPWRIDWSRLMCRA